MFDKSNIKVYNYTTCFFAVTSKNREIAFAPSTDGIPTMELMTFEEVEYINSHSNVFRVGRIEFEDDLKDELFAALKINTSECLYERDIDALISSFTLENAQRILRIKDIGTFERVRGHVVMHQNRMDVDIPTRMVTLIGERYAEIRKGMTRTDIKIHDGNEEASQVVSISMSVSKDEVQKLLEKQREEIMAAVAAAQHQPAVVSNPSESAISTDSVATSQKEQNALETDKSPAKRGRPASTAKVANKNDNKK